MCRIVAKMSQMQQLKEKWSKMAVKKNKTLTKKEQNDS